MILGLFVEGRLGWLGLLRIVIGLLLGVRLVDLFLLLLMTGVLGHIFLALGEFLLGL